MAREEKGIAAAFARVLDLKFGIAVRSIGACRSARTTARPAISSARRSCLTFPRSVWSAVRSGQRMRSKIS